MLIYLFLFTILQTALATKEGQDAFITAVRENDLDKAREQLESGKAKVNGWATEETQWTGLHYAAALDFPEMAKMLLEMGANATALAKYSDEPLERPAMVTPLQLAVVSGDKKIVEMLLEQKGLDVNAKNALGWTPLHYAAKLESPEIAKLLVRHGANLTAIARFSDDGLDVPVGVTPLHLAASEGNAETIELLLNASAKGKNGVLAVDARIAYGYTPLFYAVLSGNSASVEVLLKHGANASARANFKSDGPSTPPRATPMLLIGNDNETESVRIAELLLAHGADVNAQSLFNFTALDNAAKFGLPELVQFLLAHGADPTVRYAYTEDLYDTPAHMTTLMLAVKYADAATVKALLKDKRVDVNAANNMGWTALHFAADILDVDIAKLLLEKGANPNAKAFGINATAGSLPTITPLLRAYASASSEYKYTSSYAPMVRLLLDHGADVNAADGMHKSALIFAVIMGNVEVAKLLLEHGANVSSRFRTSENETEPTVTALHWAAKMADSEMAKLLIEHGADVNAKDLWHSTALHKAAIKNDTKTAKLLLAAGADVNARAIYSDEALGTVPHITPLHYAARFGSNEVAKLILATKKADVNVKGQHDQTPLHWAIRSGELETLKTLVKNGANVSALFNYDDDDPEITPPNMNALMLAARNGHVPIVEVLLEKGADIDAVDECGRTALQLAIATEKFPVANVLLEHGARMDVNVNKETTVGQGCATGEKSIFITAVRVGNVRLLQQLIKKTSSAEQLKQLINAQDKDGWTPLHYAAAAITEDVDLVNVLLKNGADPSIQAVDGRLAEEIAEQSYNRKIVEAIQAFTKQKEAFSQ